MPYLSNIIKKVDAFYALAESFSITKKAAPIKEYVPTPGNVKQYEGYDPHSKEPEIEESQNENTGTGLYNDIINKLEIFDNDDIANEVYVILEEYKTALKVGGGFNKVFNDINRAKSSVDDLQEDFGVSAGREASLAQDFLDEIASNMREFAINSPASAQKDEEAIKAITKAKQDAFGVIGRQEMSSQESKFERGDKTGITSGIVGPAPSANLRKEKYENDIIFLKKSLEDPTISANDKKNIPQLISIDQAILRQMLVVREVEDKLSVIPDDEEAKKNVADQKIVLDELRDQRDKLQRVLRTFNQTKKINDWMAKSNSVINNPPEKKWYDLNIQLSQIRFLDAVNKLPAVESLKSLIKETGKLNSRGDFIPLTITPERLNQLTDRFNEARQKMLSRIRYDAKQSRERALSHGKINPHYERRKGKRGGGSLRSRLNQYDMGAATFHGLVDKLGEKINTATHVARLEITQVREKGKEKTHNALKPFVDNLSKSIQNIVKYQPKTEAEKKNLVQMQKFEKAKQDKYNAIKELKEQLVNWSEKEPAIRVLEKNIRLLPFFKYYEQELNEIAKWHTPGTPWQLDASKTARIKSLFNNFEKLINMYGTYYKFTGSQGTQGKSQLELYFDKALIWMAGVLNRLEQETGILAAQESSQPPIEEQPQPLTPETTEPEEVKKPESEIDELQRLIEEQMRDMGEGRKKKKKIASLEKTMINYNQTLQGE